MYRHCKKLVFPHHKTVDVDKSHIPRSLIIPKNMYLPSEYGAITRFLYVYV